MHVEAMLRSVFNATRRQALEKQMSAPLPKLSVSYFSPKYSGAMFNYNGYHEILKNNPAQYDAIPCYTLVVNSLVSLPDTVLEIENYIRNKDLLRAHHIYGRLSAKAREIRGDLNAIGCRAGWGQNNVTLSSFSHVGTDEEGLVIDVERDSTYQFVVTVPIFAPIQTEDYVGTHPTTQDSVLFYTYLKQRGICTQQELDHVFSKRVQSLAQKTIHSPKVQ